MGVKPEREQRVRAHDVFRSAMLGGGHAAHVVVTQRQIEGRPVAGYEAVGDKHLRRQPVVVVARAGSVYRAGGAVADAREQRALERARSGQSLLQRRAERERRAYTKDLRAT